MFDFKLQKVLDYRENIEKVCKEEFSFKLSIFNKEKEDLKNLLCKKEIVKSNSYTENLKTSNDLMVYQRYVDFLDTSIANKKLLIEKAENELEKARLNLIKCTKDKKIMEILKENAFEDYLDNENKIEQNKLDDIALRGYIDSLKGGEK